MAFTQKNEIELNEALNAETLSSKVLPRWQRKALAAAAKSPAARKLQASKTPGSPAVSVGRGCVGLSSFAPLREPRVRLT